MTPLLAGRMPAKLVARMAPLSLRIALAHSGQMQLLRFLLYIETLLCCNIWCSLPPS